MFYEPKKGSPFKIDPFKSLIFPRPIGWISSIGKNGVSNLADLFTKILPANKCKDILDEILA